MNFKNLTFENLKRDAVNFSIKENDSYITAYPEFIKYFETKSLIEKHHFIIGSHFVYGWMPTILTLKMENIDQILELLNDAKKGKILNQIELATLKTSINNSMVGLSKLLHFINPLNYAIWDSRIFKYITGQKSQYGIDKAENYLAYINQLSEFSVHCNYDQFHAIVEDKLGYPVTPMRALEITMFQSMNI